MINEHSTSSFIFHVERIDQSTGQFFSYFQTVELSLYCISLKYTKILYVTIISKQKLAFRKHEDVPLSTGSKIVYGHQSLLRRKYFNSFRSKLCVEWVSKTIKEIQSCFKSHLSSVKIPLQNNEFLSIKPYG